MPNEAFIPTISRPFLIIGLSIYFAHPVGAQTDVIPRKEFIRQHAKAAVTNPDGVRAMIRFDGGRHAFHVGEYIAATYQLVGSRSDLITPPDGWDENPPDKDYVIDNSEGVARPDQIFPPNLGDFIHFGIFSYAHQRFMNYQRRINFSRHLRFTRPGHYRIFFTLTLPLKSVEATRIASKYIDLVSEIADLEILPEDTEISQTQIRKSLDTLQYCQKEHDEPAACENHDHPHRVALRHYAEVIAACDTVNYQDTRSSVMTQLELLFSIANDNCDVVRGLEETSQGEVVLEALTRRFHDATAVPNQQELYLAARLDAIRAGREIYGWETMEAAKLHYCAMVASTIAIRSGKNKADALDLIVITLDVERVVQLEKMEPVLRELMNHFAEELASVMLLLRSDEVLELLEDRWGRLKNPTLLPELQQLAQKKATGFSPKHRALLEQRIQELLAMKAAVDSSPAPASVSEIK